MLPRSVIAFAALLLALSFVACGGGAPSAEEYADDIDAECERLNSEVQELDQPESPEEIAAFAGEMRDLISGGVEELESIERPEEGEARELADEYIAALEETEEEATAALGELEEAAEEGNLEGIAEASEGLQALEAGEAGEKARELGAEVCGQDG